jgi:hypothetical protein
MPLSFEQTVDNPTSISAILESVDHSTATTIPGQNPTIEQPLSAQVMRNESWTFHKYYLKGFMVETRKYGVPLG